MTHPEKLLGVEDLAAILGISEASVYRRRSLGEPLPKALKIGRLVRWRAADVEEFLDSSVETPLAASTALEAHTQTRLENQWC